MDSDRSPADAQDYSRLNDAQLRSAIRFAEKHLRCVEEDHVELLGAYRDEINAMRRHLFDRVLRRMITEAAPLADEQQRRLSQALQRHRVHPDAMTVLIRAATNGRTDQLDALTEIEAIALLLRLEREA
jgi:hypothetical protein